LPIYGGFLGNLTSEMWSAFDRTLKRHTLHDSECYAPLCVKIHTRITSVGESVEKIEIEIKIWYVMFHVFAQTHPYERLAQILG